MKLKGKILATMLAISMLASVAVTPVFAAESSLANQEEHAVSNGVSGEIPEAPTDETTNTPAAEPPTAEPPTAEPPAAEPSAPETQAAEPTISSNMNQVEISAVGETKFLVVGVESTSTEKPPLFFLCDDESIAELSDTYITSLDDFQYVPGFSDLSQEEQQQLQAQSVGKYVVTVTGLQKGTTVINVLTDDGSLTKDIPVLVEQTPVSAPHINIKDLQINLGETVTLELLDFDGDPSMLMWYPINEDGSMWEGMMNPNGSMPIEFVDAEQGPPAGLTATIKGIGGGTMPLSILDMSRATEEELNNAQTQEEINAIFRKCRIDTCTVTGIMHMTGVKISDSTDMNKVDPSVTVHSIGGSTVYAYARAEPLNNSDQKPIVFETDDESVAKVISSKEFTIRDYVYRLLLLVGGLQGDPFVTDEQVDTAIAGFSPDQMAQLNAEFAQFKGMYMAEIQGVGVGSTTITAKTEDNTFVSTAMPVTVLNGPAKFEMNRTDSTIPTKTKAYLDISWTPSDFDPKDSAKGIKQYDFSIWDADGNKVKNGKDADLYVTTDETLTADQKTQVALVGQKPGVYRVIAYAYPQQNDMPTLFQQFTVTVVDDYVSPDSIKMDKEELKLLPNGSQTLNVTYPTPLEEGEDATVTWHSSAPSVATVDTNGTVTAVGKGTAVISAKSAGRMIAAQCTVTVAGFQMDALKLALNATHQLVVTAPDGTPYPGGVTSWTSDKTTVATVSNTGLVTAVGYGTCTITAVLDNGDKITCAFTTDKPVQEFTLNQPAWTGAAGSSFPLNGVFNPDDTTDSKDITWSTSDPAVAVVSDTGYVTILAPGPAVITATHIASGLTSTCTVDSYAFVLPESRVMVERNASKTLNLTNTLSGTVTWTSSNPDAITVDDAGVVTAADYGSSTITATAENGVQTTCLVTTAKHVETFTLDRSALHAKKDDTLNLTGSFTPEDTTDKADITWSTSDANVAAVGANGQVTAVAAGSAVITATHTASGLTATCTVEVGTFAFDSRELLVAHSASQQLALQSTLSGAVTWTSSNPDAITVNEIGVVTSVGYGSSTITATSEHGVQATCVVTTKQPLAGLDFSSRIRTAKIEETITIYTRTAPADATEKNFHYTSSDPSVATVNEQGSAAFVHAAQPGVTVITATSEDGTISASCLVVVTSSGTLNTDETSLAAGMTKQLAFSPFEGVSDVTVQSWSSDTPAVATIDANGLVTAVGNGTAKITVQLSNGEQLICQVHVIQQNTGITLNKSSITIEDPRNSEQLIATISPNDSQDQQTITWKSSKESVADVTSKGVVIPMRNGTTTITATVSAVDGSTYQATCQVTVQNVGELSPYTFGEMDEDNHTITLAGKLGTDTIRNPVLPSEIRISTKVDLGSGKYRVYTKDIGGETYRVTAIGEDAFPYYGSLLFTNPGLKGKLTLPRYLERIEESAFYGCDFTGTVEFPDTLTYIGDYAFKRHKGLYATNPWGPITIPDGVTYIGKMAFYETDFSGPLVLPSQLTYLGDAAFAYSKGFTGSLTIPGGLTYFGEEAFSGCTGLNGTLTLEEGLTSLGAYAFRNCENLVGMLTIPYTMDKISAYAFENCKGFDGLTLRNPSTLVDETAFNGCNFPNKP